MAAERIPSPVVTVAVITDYAGGAAVAWDQLRATLAALAHQRLEEPVEFLYVENAKVAERLPPDVLTILPALRVVRAPAASSYELKNAAAAAAAADMVAIIDADCIPGDGWLNAAIAAMRRHPDAAAVSGRTTYRGRTRTERILGLLSRAYVDRGHAGPTRFISTNNVIFRRSALLAHPLPAEAGPFSNRLQSEAMLRGGEPLLFEPTMRVVHGFEGWGMERDIRRNVGWSTITIRRFDGRLPWAWMLRLGYLAVPLFASLRTLESLWHCVRLARYYDVAWYEVPAALGLAVLVHALEVPGMLLALRGEAIAETAYR